MRLHWIDALKGIGIMLVVFAHHSLPVALDTYIFSFHMPLFFFISGFLFDFGKYAESAANFVKGRFESLMVPYFFFALITCLFYFLLDMAFQPGVTNIDFFGNSALYGIYSILYALGPMVSYNPPLWFLSCLFVTELLFYGLAKKFYAEPKKLVLWLTIAGVIGYLYSIYVPLRIPWNADVALSAVVFYGAGNLFRKITEPEKESESSLKLKLESGMPERFSIKKYLPVIFILLNILYLGYLLEFPTANKINMNVLKYGNFFSFYLLAFSGIFAFVYIFKKIGSSKILEYYGRNSLTVLALHFPIKDVLTKLSVLFFGIELECFYCKTAFALSLTALNLLLLVPAIYIINNYLPFILGKRVRIQGLKT
ncbi:acetyltransferase [Methanosarcina mazei]|uniref:Acetyltransferase n=2 Tax=Methanosarcina mazei TaxID=2209 RepID=A0A0F8TQD6_METMZ|nr:acyltransferase family protein [Methanosarcina mazei]KKG06263.1 acetyltransferase [Methanosarcina mazei]KKH87474.1 acetyltransferase [Methanosarcina mazei]UWJ23449.1 O-acetyl transferase [Methanosarcina mazei TMA]